MRTPNAARDKQINAVRFAMRCQLQRSLVMPKRITTASTMEERNIPVPISIDKPHPGGSMGQPGRNDTWLGQKQPSVRPRSACSGRLSGAGCSWTRPLGCGHPLGPCARHLASLLRLGDAQRHARQRQISMFKQVSLNRTMAGEAARPRHRQITRKNDAGADHSSPLPWVSSRRSSHNLFTGQLGRLWR
jgi:hypothetical protein